MKILKLIARTLVLMIHFVLIISSIYAQHTYCKLMIPLGINDVNGRTNATTIHPGDTICLLPGHKSYLALSYIHGTKDAPVVICNVDGLISISGHYFGLRVDSCSYLKLTGSGLSGLNYGIQISDVKGAGISIENLSTDIEIERVEVARTQLVGIFAKSDPDCDLKSVRGKYTLRNLIIHDDFFHHTGMEGMYIGSSFYEGKTITCNGKDTIVLPHLLKGVKIYNNIIKDTGWDGIQVSCSDSCSEIHDNSIQNDSDSAFFNQMSGIMIGKGSVCDCYNNIIQNGKGDGIDLFGLGGQRIYNNLIINQGKTYHPDENYYPYLKHGIYVGNHSTLTDSGFIICYNTIISPKSNGIKFSNLTSKNNLIPNNLIINPGLYGSTGDEAFINITEPSIDVAVYNNYLNNDFPPAKFIDPSTYNFDLEPTSPAVNHAAGIEGFSLSFDILHRSRPFSSQNDIGAFECNDSSLFSIPENLKKEIEFKDIFPNPIFTYFTVSYSIFKKSNIKIRIYDIGGKLVMEPVNINQLPGLYEYTISKGILLPGVYTLIFQTDHEIFSRKMIVFNH
ncbi:MAG: right-handed parallel beta-helix repeat-containing protein [Bacteroidales bacterium]|nr:right-handed parallel beta-helix repeat-containing protein [Bacteroidales bacterium]